ncbi:MAG: hypothetical protein D8M57_05210 [Candidatus Scalindua sp. AMX11]|nr:MAG: hypothetical protein D8M57_05210 [Candidatus Scalindua sp. AMX11]
MFYSIVVLIRERFLFMKGGEEVVTVKRGLGRILVAIFAFLFLLNLAVGQMGSVYAAEGAKCPQKKIQLHYFCPICKEINEFKDCKNINYIWDFKKYESGSEEYDEAKKHQDLPEAWGCERIKFSCIEKECEAYERCMPYPGGCDVCMGDIDSKKVWSKIDFKCTGCGKTFEHPGRGHKLDEKVEYIPTLKDPGSCEECGKPLETVCEKSGECPHVPSF